MSQDRGSVPGTEGYSEQADSLVDSYESVVFDDLYRPLLELLPEAGKALDIGAGTGRDAAALARRGFQLGESGDKDQHCRPGHTIVTKGEPVQFPDTTRAACRPT